MKLHPELNLDGLAGPTHGFGRLSFGNLASTSNRAAVSNPRAAALQGLAKMQVVASLGVPQGVLPPQERPNVALLRRLGFSGSDADVIGQAWQRDPDLLVAASSASAMWTANAATVCPSADSLDGRVHFTPANLAFQFHRAFEHEATARALRLIFPGEQFVHHDPLPSHASLGDEGAANHVRMGGAGAGVQFFVHGPAAATKFPARQTRRASEAVARLNRVRGPVFLEQSPAAIDAGAFHNDVVCVGSADVLLAHDAAFTEDPRSVEARLPGVTVLGVPEAELPLADAVATYLFNSQLVPTPGGRLAMIAPIEVREHPRARAVVYRFLEAGTRLKLVHFVELRQSMRNGGGPACLRLRVPLSDRELGLVHPGVMLTDALAAQLHDWVVRHYRDELRPADLADPALLAETRTALDELTRLLGLGSLYPFQR